MLLQRLPGYTRRELEREPAAFVNRCLMLMAAEQDEERRQHTRAQAERRVR